LARPPRVVGDGAALGPEAGTDRTQVAGGDLRGDRLVVSRGGMPRFGKFRPTLVGPHARQAGFRPDAGGKRC